MAPAPAVCDSSLLFRPASASVRSVTRETGGREAPRTPWRAGGSTRHRGRSKGRRAEQRLLWISARACLRAISGPVQGAAALRHDHRGLGIDHLPDACPQASPCSGNGRYRNSGPSCELWLDPAAASLQGCRRERSFCVAMLTQRRHRECHCDGGSAGSLAHRNDMAGPDRRGPDGGHLPQLFGSIPATGMGSVSGRAWSPPRSCGAAGPTRYNE